MTHYLFVVASTRDTGANGNTERLARRAASRLPAGIPQTWLQLAGMTIPTFIDQRHSVGSYPAPTGDLARLLEATMAATDIVLVAPVYWYSFPSTLKAYLDHWSAWLRVPGLGFKEAMGAKRLHLVTTSGDRAKAQPMIDSAKLCAGFFPMPFAGALWGKGGPPDAIEKDLAAWAEAENFFTAKLD